MKAHSLKTILLTLLLIATTKGIAQSYPNESLTLGAVAPYELEVTFDKTSHIIFPAGIRYIDLGSHNIVAGKAEDADNVLRVKAAINGFTDETNFSVITDDGQFYSFNVRYSAMPFIVSHNLTKGTTAAARLKSGDVHFIELGQTPASLAGLLMQALYEKDKKQLKKIKSKSYGITFSVKGIYIHDGKYYFHIEVENTTYIPFSPDFIRFSIVDRKIAKRTVIQQRELQPLRMYKPLMTVSGNNSERNIFMLDVFTLTKGQLLQIEIVEKNGGRGQVLRVKNHELLNAEPLNKLRLKF